MTAPLPSTFDASVYVHFPWCLRKCPYCDFATRRADRAEIPSTRYADAVCAELERRGSSFEGRRLVSVFFGGGTPSLWGASDLGRVLFAIRGAFSSAYDDVEVTVECNPSSLDRAHAERLRTQGVNRLSIGVQSLQNEQLAFLGRLHDAAGACAAVSGALEVFDRVSADLMFGLPGQSADAFGQQLETLTDLGVRHVSAYSLTIEQATEFGELHRKGKLPLAPEEGHVEALDRSRELMSRRGFEHYEVSNYAQPGERSRHNVHYWRSGSYLGLGAAAVGCLQRPDAPPVRYRNLRDPAAYMTHALEGGVLEDSVEALSAQDLVRESFMLGLRTLDGTDLGEVRTRTGLDPLTQCDQALRKRTEMGDLVVDNGFLRVPEARWLRLDGIVSDLF